MKCACCDSESLFESKLMQSASGTVGFFLEPAKGKLIKRGVEPTTWICEDCGHVMFFLPPEDRKRVFRAR